MKKRITKKELNNFIERIAFIEEKEYSPGDFSKRYVSKIDRSYLTLVGMEDSLKYLLKHGITEEIQNYHNEPGCSASIGFNPEEQKWYGWFHRAMYGFTIGSTCSKGDCHYQPANKEDFIENALKYRDDALYLDTKVEEVTVGVEKGIRLLWLYSPDTPNESIRGTWGERFIPYPSVWGEGEWKAETIEDAKQMACDFAASVS